MTEDKHANSHEAQAKVDAKEKRRQAEMRADLESQQQTMYNHQQQAMYDPLQQQQMMMAASNSYLEAQNYYPTLDRMSHNQAQAMMTARQTPAYMSNGPAEYMYGEAGAMYPQMSQPLLACAPQPIAYQNIQQPYDNCPTICSLFAIFCCPITCICSLPALVYSLCAYTDYRADDLHHYRSKSDKARRLVISACLVGLLLCVSWAILTYFYYDQMVTFLSEFISIVNKRIRRSNGDIELEKLNQNQKT